MGTTSGPPQWVKPQLTRLVDEAPAGAGWVHEIKYDGYRMHARELESVAVTLWARIVGNEFEIELLSRPGMLIARSPIRRKFEALPEAFTLGGSPQP